MVQGWTLEGHHRKNILVERESYRGQCIHDDALSYRALVSSIKRTEFLSLLTEYNYYSYSHYIFVWLVYQTVDQQSRY